MLDLIAEEAIIDRDKLTREATLADLGISSLDVITLLFELEERYGVVIEQEDLPPDLQTLGDMVDFLIKRIAEEPAKT
ncbi:MAG: acyl carrier protein [Caulobacterales bacterium]